MKHRKHERMTNVELAEMERRAIQHIRSVPYGVTLRWVFYRLLQDCTYSKKTDYERFGKQASKFRHEGTWPADILTDESRVVVERGIDRAWSPAKIIESITDPSVLATYLCGSHFDRQAYYTELWFEARGMLGQFKEYTRGIVLRPFGGQYTVPMKYAAAQDMAKYARRFKKPVKILYFGDADDWGHKIYKAATTGSKGFMKWCSDLDIEVEYCGLTAEQAESFDPRVPENPDKPGDYQWEALTDEQARHIITHSVERYVDDGIIDATNKNAERRGRALSRKLRSALS